MAKIVQNLTQCLWICLISGVGGTVYNLFRQWQTGVVPAFIGFWVNFIVVGVVLTLVRSGLKNLDERLTKLEQSKSAGG